ncbi:SAG-related sequence [Besnoitia besnoiti]|uniref:SAG-related sequence n=1 Tax=Besnoitia besnoiti TaxID=94643 RepID=A0A2A9MJX0_BESBE|nr:SAG-related sequence [Besnoitia besnoiti]PFH36551.1 SAG-related sequence [Besnoitia besnoiti]
MSDFGSRSLAVPCPCPVADSLFKTRRKAFAYPREAAGLYRCTFSQWLKSLPSHLHLSICWHLRHFRDAGLYLWETLQGGGGPASASFSKQSILSNVLCALLFVRLLCGISPSRAQLSQPTGAVPECTSADKLLALSLTGSESKLQFQCGPKVTTLEPAKVGSSFTQFCKDPKCEKKGPLNELHLSLSDQDASERSDKKATTYSLSATELPDAPSTIYFVCPGTLENLEKSMRSAARAALPEEQDQTCVVQISVWGKKPTPLEPSSVCNGTPNKSVALNVDSDHTPVTFGCGDERGLSPALLDYVFQLPAGEKGLTAVPLQSLVPKATLIANGSGEPSRKTAAYTLSVPELPEAGPVQLVYKCAALKSAPVPHVVLQQEEDQVPKEECRVVIEVAKRPTSSGSDDETSGERATSLSAVWALALGVLTHFLNRV